MACNRIEKGGVEIEGGTSTNTIIIYRMEEWFKVLIHESFHSMGLDFSGRSPTIWEYNENVERAFHRFFPAFRSEEIRVYECYTEAWAEILYVLYLTNSIEGFQRAFQRERIHSFSQSRKILQHYGRTYEGFLVGDTNANTGYTEETPVFSYFILKSILFYYWKEFIEWTDVNNGGSLCFSVSSVSSSSFSQFFENRFRNPVMIKEVFGSTIRKGDNTNHLKMTTIKDKYSV